MLISKSSQTQEQVILQSYGILECVILQTQEQVILQVMRMSSPKFCHPGMRQLQTPDHVILQIGNKSGRRHLQSHDRVISKTRIKSSSKSCACHSPKSSSKSFSKSGSYQLQNQEHAGDKPKSSREQVIPKVRSTPETIQEQSQELSHNLQNIP